MQFKFSSWLRAHSTGERGGNCTAKQTPNGSPHVMDSPSFGPDTIEVPLTENGAGRNVDGRYDCPKCPATFAFERGVQRHLKEKRCNRPRLVLCAKKVYDYQQIGNRFACPHCKATFAQAGNIPAHLRKNCPVLFPEKKRDLKKTFNLTKSGRSICPHCNITFGRAAAVERHLAFSCAVASNGAHSSGGGFRSIVLRSAQYPDTRDRSFTTVTAACNFLKSGKSQFYIAMRSKKAYKGWYVVDEGKSGEPGASVAPESGNRCQSISEIDFGGGVETDDSSGMIANTGTDGEDSTMLQSEHEGTEHVGMYSGMLDGQCKGTPVHLHMLAPGLEYECLAL